MSQVQYPVITIRDDMDDDTKAFAEMLNWQASQLAVQGARIAEIYEVFAQLKPLMGAMPKMPAGLTLPGAGMFPGR